MKNLLRISFRPILLIYFGLFLFSTSYAQQLDLREALNSAVGIIEYHTSAETASLNVVSVTESRQNALKTDSRIAGYPVVDTLISFDKNKSLKLGSLLLDKNSYTNIRQRCKNQFFHGVRFNKADEIIEVAIGVPCNQVLIVFRDGRETKWWGNTMGDAAVKQALKLLCHSSQ